MRTYDLILAVALALSCAAVVFGVGLAMASSGAPLFMYFIVGGLTGIGTACALA